MNNNLADYVNRCEFLFVLSITFKDDSLEIVVLPSCQSKCDERKPHGESSDALNLILEEAEKLCPDFRTAFKFVFSKFIAYQVSDESVTVGYDNSFFERGKLFCRTKTSPYLDYVLKTTLADLLYDNIYHYRICTLDEIIDVVSCEEPYIEKIEFIERSFFNE